MSQTVTLTKTEFKTRLRRALLGIAIDLEAALKRDCPVHTGVSKSQIHTVVIDDGRVIEVRMPGVLLYVEFGTPPHIIRAKNAKALRFSAGGENVFARLVHHPGTMPQPFIRNIFRNQLKGIINSNLMHYMRAGAE